MSTESRKTAALLFTGFILEATRKAIEAGRDPEYLVIPLLLYLRHCKNLGVDEKQIASFKKTFKELCEKDAKRYEY